MLYYINNTKKVLKIFNLSLILITNLIKIIKKDKN